MKTFSITRLCAFCLMWLPLLGCSVSNDGNLDDGGNVNQNGGNSNANDNGGTNDNANGGANGNDNGGAGGDGNTNDNGGSNTNDNINDNGAENGNTNDNGNENDNTNANTNMNDNGNANDNTNQNDNGADCAGGFTLTVDLISVGAGSVVLSPQADCFAPGSEVTITATANPTFRFVGFGGDVQSSSAATLVVMDTDKSVSATFAGNLFVASNTSVLEFDSGSGAFVREFVAAGAGGLAGPSALAFGPQGHLFVSVGDAILKFDGTDGGFIEEFVSAGEGNLTSGWGIAFDAGEDLLVADGDTVRQYDGTNGGFVGEFVTAESGGLESATAMRFGPSGNLFVAGAPGAGLSGAIWEYDGSTGALVREFVALGSDGLGIIFDMIFGTDGDLFVAVPFPPLVRRYDGSSGMPADCPCLCFNPCPGDTEAVGPYEIEFLLSNFPSGLAWGPQDNLLIVSDGTVRQFEVPAAGPMEVDVFIPTDDAFEINSIAYLAIKPLP